MALVVGPTDKENREGFGEFLREQQKQVTELRGSDGTSVFALADYLLGDWTI
jgi:hypothetical protein